MAWQAPPRGALRASLKFQRRLPQANVGGVVAGGPASFTQAKRCLMEPIGGGETGLAARLAGHELWRLTVPADRELTGLTTDDLAVDARDDGRIFDIRTSVDPDGRGRWLVMTLERGRSDGGQGA